MSKNVTAKPVTATSTTKVTEELLICRLCSLKYSTDGRRPMALRCVHTFCERCLEQLLRDQLDDSDPTKNQKQRRDKRQPLVCPTCETVTHLAKGCMPSSLPVNPSVMELLEIFDGLRAVEDLQQSGVRNTPVVPGYSQVKVTATKSRGQDSTANGQLSQQPDSTAVSALMKHKEDTRGLDPASRRSHGNGSVDEGGGGGARNMKLISTVNVGTSSPHLQQQQQQHQQQQSTASFSTAKLSSVPAAMTSAVTSVSTLKMHPQQSSSTSSSTVVSSCDTNAGPTSTAPAAVAHKCCRCGLRPAAVSVASSSQTMTPKKLCSDCWNQPVAGKNGEDQKRGAASVGAEEQIVTTTADTKQPERFSVTAGKISMVKADLRSDVNASAMTQTTEAANTGPQTEKDDSAAANSSSSSAPLKRETAAAGLVANGKSTIEVRRRSGYFDNRARAAPTSTPDSSTTEAAATGTTVDQPAAVQSTTVRTANAARGSKPRQPLAIDAPQGSTIDGTSPDAQLNAVPEAISEERPTSSGSKSDTGGSTNHLGNTAEVGEHGVVRDNTSCRGSAPSIAEIHPLPCSNPPYNPDFIEDSSTAWSSIENQRRASDTPAATGRLNLTSPETRSHEQHQRKQQPQDISATAGKGLALSFLLSNSGHRYPAEQPPKYEDIIHENEAIAATARESPASRTQSSQAVLPAPIEPVAATATPAAMRLVRSFGKYGEISTQPGAFREPGRVCVSPAAEKEETSTRVIVSDKANGTVQVFGDAGECLSMLRADAVRGCCLLDNSRKLLLATSRGVEVSCALTISVVNKN